MAVYKKDGSVYKLNGPNHLMIEQEKWGSFVTHNMKNLSNLKMESNISHVVLGNKKQIEVKEENIKTIIEQPVEVEEKKEEIVSNFIEKESKEKEYFENYNKTIMHCALAKLEEIKDVLYNDTYIKKKYVDSFTFECIILSVNDFTMIFWTKLEKLAVGSIVYPQNDSKRWWEIKEIESVPGGYKIVCVITKNTLAF